MKKKLKMKKKMTFKNHAYPLKKKRKKKKYPTVHRPHDMRNQHRSRA